MHIIDITREMLSSPVYPGCNAAEIKQVSSMSKGDIYNLSVLCSDVHCGTHADAPLHFLPDGLDIASMPLLHYIGECYVINVESGLIEADYLIGKIPQGSKRILLKTNGRAYLSDECAYAIVKNGIITIGIDNLSVADFNNEYSIHTILLNANVAILESLNLAEVEAGKYFLSAAPLKIKGSDGSFIRAVLIKF